MVADLTLTTASLKVVPEGLNPEFRAPEMSGEDTYPQEVDRSPCCDCVFARYRKGIGPTLQDSVK